MNSWCLCEVERSSGYTTLLTKPPEQGLFEYVWLFSWDYSYLLSHHRNMFLRGSSSAWSEPASECDTQWKGEVFCSAAFLQRVSCIAVLGNPVLTPEHLWWMKNRRFGLSFTCSLSFFWEFESSVCNANKDASKIGSLAYLMGEMFHCVENLMI